VNIAAEKAHGLDHLVEQLPGSADKRFALKIFVASRPLANEHQTRLRIADTKYNMGASFAELAAGTIADVVANALKRFRQDRLRRLRTFARAFDDGCRLRRLLCRRADEELRRHIEPREPEVALKRQQGSYFTSQ